MEKGKTTMTINVMFKSGGAMISFRIRANAEVTKVDHGEYLASCCYYGIFKTASSPSKAMRALKDGLRQHIIILYENNSLNQMMLDSGFSSKPNMQEI